MVQARIGVGALALLLLAGVSSAAAQEIVLTNGTRLAGVVERYEGGFAYIRLFKESGKTVLTTMPESAVDKAATERAQATGRVAAEPREAPAGPFKLPHNDLSRTQPGIAAVAAAEKERRTEALDSGAATGRVFKNGQRAGGILTGRDVELLADLREQPEASPDLDAAQRVAGLRFYEARLDALSSAFSLLGEEWEDMWRHCTPITYVGSARSQEASSPASRPDVSYREAVMTSFRRSGRASSMGDHWSVSCMRRDSDYLARGRQIVEAYDVVFTAYAAFADGTGHGPETVTRALPTAR
jgi:hypothetical protein